MKTVREYDVLDFGVDNEQYFQGCGTALTTFTQSAVGAGDNFAEAIDDALEMVAQNGFDSTDLEARMLRKFGRKKWPTKPDVRSVVRKYREKGTSREDAMEGMYYYVCIRWK
jgi:hypothetical protein